jgi:two-component system, cell cycle sensor histidine kinase and response regulator CckA
LGGFPFLESHVKFADQVFPAGHRPTDAAAPHVLVVDDEPLLRRFAVRVLAADGYILHEASDGFEALELVNADAELLDVVVSDIVMPRVNGVELLETLSVTHPELPVVLMSGYATPELTELGIAAPCAVLSKPFSAERLLDEVRRCLRSRS